MELQVGKLKMQIPDRMTMFYYEKILPIQKQIELGDISEIKGTIKLCQAINVGDIQNQAIEDEIYNLEIDDFTKLAEKLGDVLVPEIDKKK